MNLEKFKHLVNQASSHLRNNNYYQLADELDKYLEGAERGEKESVDEIIKRCHIKWMGDIFIEELEFDDWIQLLEKVKKSAQE